MVKKKNFFLTQKKKKKKNVSKNNHIEIHTTVQGDLKSVITVPIYGRLSCISLFRPKGFITDLIFLLTERNSMCVLEYDSVNNQVNTITTGSLHDYRCRVTEYSPIGIIDPFSKVICIHVYEGILKIIPITLLNGKVLMKSAKNLNLEELNVRDLIFLEFYGDNICEEPTICILFEEEDSVHLRVYTIDILNKSKKEIEILGERDLYGNPKMLVPIPRPIGGFLILGELSVVYKNLKIKKQHIFSVNRIISAFEVIDKTRIIFGDVLGKLYLLILKIDEKNNVTSLQWKTLGKTTIVSSISYVDDCVLYIGSQNGDSKLIKLLNKREDDSLIKEIGDDFPNIGPIVDFVVVDNEKQGQGTIVSCSGVYESGSLRIIHSGIGIEEHATLQLEGVTGIWNLKKKIGQVYDDYIVLSFVNQTNILALNENTELNEVKLGGFQLDTQTLFCGTIKDNLHVQITRKKIVLIDTTTFNVEDVWETNENILQVDVNPTQILISKNKKDIILFKILNKKIVKLNELKIGSEIASININPLNDGEEADVCVLGLWDQSLLILSVPKLQNITKIELNELPRNVLLITFEKIHYLFCSLGNGFLLSYILDKGKLNGYKKLSLGNKSAKLKVFTLNNEKNVMAGSDRPTVIYSKHQQLGFSAVNIDDILNVCPFKTEEYPNNLVIITEGEMIVGGIEEIQRIHIRTIKLGEQPRKICHHEKTDSLVILTLKQTVGDNGISENGFIKIFNSINFDDKKLQYKLKTNEHGSSVAICKFIEEEYVVVGTTFAHIDEVEPRKGRILIFKLKENSLELISENIVDGAVMVVTPFQGKLLTGINCQVRIYNWVSFENQYTLELECKYEGHIFTITLHTNDHFIFLGDVMKSMNLLRYDRLEGKPPQITEVASDYEQRDLMDGEIIDNDSILSTDYHGNIFLLKRRDVMEEDSIEHEEKLEMVSCFHLGDTINVLKKGSIIMKDSNNDLILKIKTYIYATVSGAVGIIAQLPKEIYDFLKDVERAVSQEVKGIGDFDHLEYRSYFTDRNKIPSKNFIDGDLVTQFLSLNVDRKIIVLKNLMKINSKKYEKLTLLDFERKIEEFSRNIE